MRLKYLTALKKKKAMLEDKSSDNKQKSFKGFAEGRSK